VLAQGTDLEKFRRAEQLYRTKNYEGASQQLEQILSGFYNQISTPPVYTIHYNIAGTAGTLNEQTFARACSLLAQSKAQLGDFDQASAVVMTFASRIRMSDPVQENLLRETYDQLAVIAKGGTTSGSGSQLSEVEQRRLLREANSVFRQQRYEQADEKLSTLIASHPGESVFAEALFLHGKALYQLGREQESLAALERIVDEFTSSKEYPEALWSLGMYYESGDDSFHAVEYFQVLADKFPNFKYIDGALYYLAVDDLLNGNGRKAAANLARIHRTHRNGLYWSHAAWMLAYDSYKKKDYVTAERYVQEILRNPPDVAILDRVLYLKGELSLRRDDYQSAFLAFNEVRKLCPGSPLFHFAVENARLALAANKVSVN
jgi:TolA-binding protein